MGKKGLETRRHIIAKALQIFSVKGYFNTSINDIMAATSLTRGGIYCHFSSKEDIWYAVFEEADRIWRNIVFKGVRDLDDPLERIEKTIANDLNYYLSANVFEGGCFFLNSLVELSGQSALMTNKILKGYRRFSNLFRKWLAEANNKQLLKPGLDFEEIANFIIISLNGVDALYASTREPDICRQTLNQLKFYVNQLRRKAA